MNETIPCAYCSKEMPAERLECGYNACKECNNEQPALVFEVYEHKTAPGIVIIKGGNKEAIRMAHRANRRAR